VVLAKTDEQLRERVRVAADAVLANVEPGTDFDVMAELADITIWPAC
jgi:hypothetical protein